MENKYIEVRLRVGSKYLQPGGRQLEPLRPTCRERAIAVALQVAQSIFVYHNLSRLQYKYGRRNMGDGGSQKLGFRPMAGAPSVKLLTPRRVLRMIA